MKGRYSAQHQQQQQMDIRDDVVDSAVAGNRDDLQQCLEALESELLARISIAPQWRRSLDAADILQVSYLEAFLRIATLRDRTANGLRKWLHRIIENNTKDAVRGLERHKRPDAQRRITSGPEGQSARTLLARLASEDNSISHHSALAEDVERLHGAIARLPSSYRTAINLLEIDELPIDEVAERLGRSKGATHLLRARGIARLRELLTRRPCNPDQNF